MKMSPKPWMLAAAVAALAPGLTAAQPLTYNYAQGEVMSSEIEDTDGEGLALGISALFAPNLFVIGDFETIDYDDDIDLQSISAGVGGRMPLQMQGPYPVELYGAVTFEHLEIETDGGEEDDQGLGVRGGIRGEVSPNTELFAEVRLNEYDDADGQFLRLGGLIGVAQNLAVLLAYQTGEYDFDGAGEADRDDLRAGLRYSF